ncbi:MAG: hypothetical protein AUH42_01525 [Gemmatimonadetes bacterium 13_1_40CM_70_11]|nr:MAG: hypothetical protein AUH42_01525 [Gemmatimonadetes bacterium 13_1_40CM_70_11]
MLEDFRPGFRALVQTIVPDASRLDTAGWAAVEQIIERALASRPPALRRQLRLFLHALEWLPFLYYGRRFTALDPVRRSRFLQRIQDAPLLLLRRGVWGLRTLILLGYYGRPAAAAEIGYRADPRGWEARP